MSPTFNEGEEILVNRLSFLFKKPKAGDIIACKDPRDRKILIKRISKIEDNKYFVVGDNKQNSTDSRKFGMIEKSDILGCVLL
jgi:nickel-type superoxide dismutase maturation protease